MAAQERSLSVEGKNIQLFEGGAGPPLLYLHDAGTFWWMPVHDLLAHSFYVYLPVHPGFGNSEGGEEVEEGQYVICGSPQTVRQKLREGIKSLNCRILLTAFQLGNMPHHLATKNMELFAREVMPYLREEFP